MFFDSIKFNNMFNENDSLIKGTIFANEYKPYKNYKESNINVSNDKENLLLNIYRYDFMINDLNLFLDLHPDDTNVYNLFKEYSKRLKYYVELYESRYGSINLIDDNYNSYLWYKDMPFGGAYV